LFPFPRGKGLGVRFRDYFASGHLFTCNCTLDVITFAA
jgi:hypothetical protein